MINLATPEAVRADRLAFSRGGALSPELMVALLLFMVGDGRRRGYREMLEAAWEQGAQAGIPLPTEKPVSASAFCQARDKVSCGFLSQLLAQLDERFDAAFPDQSRWRGRRVLAVDGSSINLQRSHALFRAYRCASEAHNPQAKISTLINVISKVPVDVAVGPYQASERHLLTESHLRHVRSGDIVVLDRGYPGSNEFAAMLEVGADFVVRMSTAGSFSQVQQFAGSSASDCELLLDPSSTAESRIPIPVRLIRSKRNGGEDVIIATTLRRSDGYSIKDIEQLYKLRWEAEEYYKALKSDYMAQGQLHARNPIGVRQEIIAMMIFHSLSRLALAAAAVETGTPYSVLSTKAACVGTFDYLLRMFFHGREPIQEWAHRLVHRLARSHVPRRPNRSYPRRSFRPGPRWGPSGRSRA
jgi:hypothetical protein